MKNKELKENLDLKLDPRTKEDNHDIIRSKQELNSLIKETLWDCENSPVTFPRKLHFCGGLGEPTFIITIEKLEEEKCFVDEKGRKWVRAD